MMGSWLPARKHRQSKALLMFSYLFSCLNSRYPSVNELCVLWAGIIRTELVHILMLQTQRREGEQLVEAPEHNCRGKYGVCCQVCLRGDISVAGPPRGARGAPNHEG